MVDRFIHLGAERQKDVLTYHIRSAKRLAGIPHSGITPAQVSTVIDHMFAAVTYWMTGPEQAHTDRFVRGAVSIIRSSGRVIGAINTGVGAELSKLGNAMEYVSIGVVQNMAQAAGFGLRTLPEDTEIYERIGSGKIGREELAEWLTTVPAKK